MQSFGMTKMLNATFDEALAKVPEALKTEGFGVLTEIDVADTLKKKLGVEFRKYRILGACNPPFAHKALQTHLEVGLFMPCNVVVYENDEGKAVVSAVDPMQTMATRAGAEMQELAAAIREKLSRVLDRIE
jgi:uncharacterized protein (DUF302 family)